MIKIKTERLILRSWTRDDLVPFASLNADARVMEYFPSTLSKRASDEMARRVQEKIEEKGWGLWAVSLTEKKEFIGFMGLSESKDSYDSLSVEISWRLGRDFWGKGYATEGARAVLRYGFETINLREIKSFAAAQNVRSVAIMEKIGMSRDTADDWMYVDLPQDRQQQRDVLYRISYEEWQENQKIRGV